MAIDFLRGNELNVPEKIVVDFVVDNRIMLIGRMLHDKLAQVRSGCHNRAIGSFFDETQVLFKFTARRRVKVID